MMSKVGGTSNPVSIVDLCGNAATTTAEVACVTSSNKPALSLFNLQDTMALMCPALLQWGSPYLGNNLFNRT